MGCLLLFLLSYPLTRGLYRHGVLGSLLLALFMLHHGVNWLWYKTLLKGRWNLRRCITTGIDVLLFMSALAVIVSSLYMSGEIFSFMPFPMTWWARSLHNCATAWLFIIGAIHLGVRWRGLWNLGRRFLGKIWIFVALIIFIISLYCCWLSGFWLSLLSETTFLPETIEQFLIQYLGIALGFYLLPQMLFYLFNRIRVNQTP